jgi:hemoglobin-like flavoprotein
VTPKYEILQNHLKTIAPHAGDFVSTFYNRLYTHYPEIRPLFKDDNRKELFTNLEFIVNHLSDQKQLLGYLRELADRHHSDEVNPADWLKVGEAVFDTLSEFSAEYWTLELDSSWMASLNRVQSLVSQAGIRPRAAASQ